MYWSILNWDLGECSLDPGIQHAVKCLIGLPTCRLMLAGDAIVGRKQRFYGAVNRSPRNSNRNCNLQISILSL